MNKLLWVDDENARTDLARSIAESLTLECVYLSLQEARSILRGSMSGFDAIFVDHYLTRNVDERDAGSNKGASLCSEFRVCCPYVPIFGISAAREDQLSLNERSEYDFFATATEYRNSILIDMVKSAVAGFRQLKQLVKSDSVHGDEDFIDVVLRQFDVPSDDSSLMKKILPSCLSVREKFNIHMAFQWVLKKFLKKDGILIGSKTIAAMIGLKEEPFMEKIKPKLHDCHYRGLFAFGDDTFWRSTVFAVLANLTGNDGSMPLSHYCTKLDGVEDEDCATCIKCGERYTELLAYEDRSPTAKAYPVHYKCSIEVEEGQSLFFDSEYLVKESN